MASVPSERGLFSRQAFVQQIGPLPRAFCLPVVSTLETSQMPDFF